MSIRTNVHHLMHARGACNCCSTNINSETRMTEGSSHYRILTSKHDPQLTHLENDNERKYALDDFSALETIEASSGNNESQELFDIVDQILTERNESKDMDEQIIEMKHRLLEKRKQALKSDDQVEELKQKISDVKKVEGPSYKTSTQSEKTLERLRKSLSKHNRSELLRKGIFECLEGKSKPSRYAPPSTFKADDLSTFADMNAAELLNACNAIRLYLSLDSGANDVLKCMKEIEEQKAKLKTTTTMNEDLAKRKGLTDDNEDLDRKIEIAAARLKKMEDSAYQDKEKRIREMATAETEDELTHGMNPLNPVAVINFLFGSPEVNSAEDADGKILTKRERQMKKAMESLYANEVANAVDSDANRSNSFVTDRRKSHRHRSLIIRDEDTSKGVDS